MHGFAMPKPMIRGLKNYEFMMRMLTGSAYSASDLWSLTSSCSENFSMDAGVWGGGRGVGRGCLLQLLIG